MQHDKWRTYNPKVNEAKAMHAKSLQPKDQSNMYSEIEEFTTQRWRTL